MIDDDLSVQVDSLYNEEEMFQIKYSTGATANFLNGTIMLGNDQSITLTNGTAGNAFANGTDYLTIRNAEWTTSIVGSKATLKLDQGTFQTDTTDHFSTVVDVGNGQIFADGGFLSRNGSQEYVISYANIRGTGDVQLNKPGEGC